MSIEDRYMPQSTFKGEPFFEDETRLFAYHISPIDDWSDWQYLHGDPQPTMQIVEAMASEVGWEGDTKRGPFFRTIEHEGETHKVIAFKQENNGNCMVVSTADLAEANDVFGETVFKSEVWDRPRIMKEFL